MSKKPHTHSRMGQISRLEVGGSLIEETTLEGYGGLQRMLNPPLRPRPADMKNRVFKTQLYTLVSNFKAGDIRYAVRVERLEDKKPEGRKP